MELECEATFKSLGQTIQMRLLALYPKQAEYLFNNPKVKIKIKIIGDKII